jgi:pimeloyl-ACP methyl ester carboxylesterase
MTIKVVRFKLILFVVFLMVSLASCEREEELQPIQLTEIQTSIQGRIVTSYISGNTKEFLFVFESGLGDAAMAWKQGPLLDNLAPVSDVLIYDRAGYGKSDKDLAQHDIPKLSDDLKHVVEDVSHGRKIIIVGHSFGGLLIRDYAIKNSLQVAAIVFIDPLHEAYSLPIMSQQFEDVMYNDYKTRYGETHGAAMDARFVIEDLQYCNALPNLPNVPVIVFTSKKTDVGRPADDRQKWFDAHAQLGNGISDFEHLSTSQADHYIHRDDPAFVAEKLKALIARL